MFTISQASEKLGVSIDTLRRWDKSGKLVAIRKEGGTHRYYRENDIEVFASNLVGLARDWTEDGLEPPAMFYCSDRSIFESRLKNKMSVELMRADIPSDLVSLVTAIAGEIGNNSFDHNMGKWPDVPGVFFGYDTSKRQIVLADRGIGIMATLSRVRPGLKNHEEALKVAFNEIVSGRAPEDRGNGLKFVVKIIAQYPISLFFQSGDAELRLEKDSSEQRITKSAVKIRGCFAFIEF